MQTLLDEYFEHKETFLDTFIDTGSDQELFVASYIHGHFSVEAAKVSSQMHLEPLQAIELFELQLSSAINLAIQNQELSDTDAKDVQQMLQALATV